MLYCFYAVAADVLCNSVCPIMTILAVGDWTWMASYLTLLNTMSTSVVVTFLPSMMWQSLHIFAKFLPFISFPVALVSPWTANFWKEVSTSVIDTVASAILAEGTGTFEFLVSVQANRGNIDTTHSNCNSSVIEAYGCIVQSPKLCIIKWKQSIFNTLKALCNCKNHTNPSTLLADWWLTCWKTAFMATSIIC